MADTQNMTTPALTTPALTTPSIDSDFAGWTAANWARLVPGSDSTAAAVAIRFIRIADDLAQSHARTIKPWNKQGIATIGDFRILGILRHIGDEGMRTHHIADRLGFDPSTVSQRISRLHKHGFVERVEDPNNRRSHFVRLIPAKESIVDDIYKALVANHETFFSSIDTEEHEVLSDILGRL